MKTALCLILLSPRCSLQFARFKGVGLDRHLGGPLFDHFLITHFVSMLSCACLLILFSPLLCLFVNFYKLRTPFGRLEVPLPIKKNETTPFTTICLFHFFFLFLFCSLLLFPPSLTREMTSISPYLIPKQNFPSSISVLVFCKVYSGKREKSEPFPLFYITKTKRSKNSGKIFEEICSFLSSTHRL